METSWVLYFSISTQKVLYVETQFIMILALFKEPFLAYFCYLLIIQLVFCEGAFKLSFTASSPTKLNVTGILKAAFLKSTFEITLHC